MITDAEAAVDAAPAYLTEAAAVGFGFFSFSHAAETVQAYSATAMDVTADVIAIPLAVTAPGFGLSFSSSSVAAATTTVAANSHHCQWVSISPLAFLRHILFFAFIRC